MSDYAGPAAPAALTPVTLAMIRAVRPERLRAAAASLQHGSTNLGHHHGDLVGNVRNPLLARLHWSGVGQPQAAARTNRHATQVNGVSQRLHAAATVLGGVANYLTAAKRQVALIDATAQHRHLTVHGSGEVTIDDRAALPSTVAGDRAEDANQLRALAHAVLIVTAKVDAKAAAALTALQGGDPTSPPSPVDARFWKQAFERFVVPPLALGAGGVALWTAGWGLRVNTAAGTWASLPRHRVTRAYRPRHVARRPPSTRRVNWLEVTRKWNRHAGFVVAAGWGALDQWHQDSGRTDLDTEERVARAGYRGAVVGVGSLAGAELGSAVGGLIELAGGPVGVAIGKTLGGTAGGIAGYAVGDWIADKTVDQAGRVGGGWIHRQEKTVSTVVTGAKDAWHETGGWVHNHPWVIQPC